jgi:AAA domain
MDWGCSLSVSIELKKTPIGDGRLLIEVIKGGALMAAAPCMVDDPADRGRCIASLVHQAPYLKELGLESKMLEQTAPRGIAPIPFGDFVRDYPEMRPEVIKGILRQGETMNIISSAKVGKSFLAGGMAWSVATGRDWLSHAVTQSKVLIIDNELHSETLARARARCG